ncbi:sugar kinase [Rhizobium sp. LjRoot254]|uniref:sugar kinase n=1 Tax=Rhizobium sp. LjRoot254 TaxID=3342297 RepID=UPI003ECC53B9
MPRFLSIGECMIELASLGGDMMRKGFAGDTFNTAWYARAFLPESWAVEYFTALGDDRASGEMLEFMASAGVETGRIRRLPGKAPGLYMIHLDQGERSFSYWRSVSAARQLADDRETLRAAIDAADVIYFSGITLAILVPEARKTLLELMQAARDGGKTVAFDPNIRPRLWADKQEMLSSISAAAATASIVLPGFDDEAAHFGDGSVEKTIERYHRLGVASVIVKDGAKGATISDQKTVIHIPAHPPAAVVDTTSAGDSFNGGYLARLAADDSPSDSARFAARLASAVIGQPGALISREKLGL